MTPVRLPHLVTLLAVLLLGVTLSAPLMAEEEEQYLSEEQSIDNTAQPPARPPGKTAPRRTKPGPRYYLTNRDPRVDSGVFHVAIAVGGNFYTEPAYDTTGALTEDSFKDFGFQAGVYFDWDYSELDENIPLGLRGMAGYKYILNSVHVFAFDGVVRQMWRFSENASFGLGLGASAAIWYRAITDQSDQEEIIFLPSFVISAGFDFTPFMADFKVLINRWSADTFIAGAELYFGFRL